jgi:hypothetical protein
LKVATSDQSITCFGRGIVCDKGRRVTVSALAIFNTEIAARHAPDRRKQLSYGRALAGSQIQGRFQVETDRSWNLSPEDLQAVKATNEAAKSPQDATPRGTTVVV